MKKHIVMAGLLVALGVGGAYGYKYHQRTEVIELVTPAVKNASIRVINASKLDTDKTSITFKELFERLEDDTSEIEKRSIEIQSASNKNNADITDPAVAYMKDCQEFSRALNMKYRKALAFSNSVDRMSELLDEPMPSSSYGFELRKSRRDKRLAEMNEAQAEAEKAQSALIAATKRLKEARSKVTGTLPDDALVTIAQLDAVIKHNTPAKDEKASGDSAKAKS